MLISAIESLCKFKTFDSRQNLYADTLAHLRIEYCLYFRSSVLFYVKKVLKQDSLPIINAIKNLEIGQVDSFFGYLAEHMFTDATVENAVEHFGDTMTSEHSELLRISLKKIKENLILSSKLSVEALTPLVSDIQLSVRTANNTTVYAKHAAVVCETSLLKRILTETKSE